MNMMTKKDFLTARSFLRFSKMGVLPSEASALAAFHAIRNAEITVFDQLAVLIAAVGAGVLPGTEVCTSTERALTRFYEMQTLLFPTAQF